MKVLLLAGAGSIGLGLLVSGQAQSEAAAQTVFEVASVKPSGPQCVRMSDGGPGSHDPERFSYTSAHLRDLLFVAYGLIDYEQQISGPGGSTRKSTTLPSRFRRELRRNNFN